MSDIQNDQYIAFKSWIDEACLKYEEKEEESCKRIDIRNGKFSIPVKFFKTGTIQVQGKQSDLKEKIEKVAKKIE